MDIDELERRAGKIADEWQGIFATYEAFYIQSIMYTADRCLESFERYDKLRRDGGAGVDQVSAVHEALGHAASLSRYFWQSGAGPRKRPKMSALQKARAQKLRDAFGLSDSSALRDRSLRDSLEHFDERLDEYLLRSGAGQYLPLPRVGDSDGLPDGIKHIFKLVDPERQVFVILDRRFEFGPILAEVEQILLAARRLSENGDRLPHREPQ